MNDSPEAFIFQQPGQGPLSELVPMADLEVHSMDTHKDEDGLSPTSKRLIERNDVTFTKLSEEAQSSSSSLVLQRPITSGLELGGFNFGKPAQSTLRFSHRFSPSSTLLPNSTVTSHAPQSQPRFHASTTSSVSVKSASHQLGIMSRESGEQECENRKIGGNIIQSPIHHRSNTIQETANNHQTRKENIISFARMENPNGNLISPRIVRLVSSVAEQTPKPSHKAISKAVKPSEKAQSTSNSQKQISDRAELTEEEIFRLLIQKMRVREEQEIATRSLKDGMKWEIGQLMGKNQALNEKLQEVEKKEHQLLTENEAYKEKLEHCSSKVQKMRLFLNGLGADYESLRLDEKQFKTTQNELAAEKSSIAKELSEIKSQYEQSLKETSEHAHRLSELKNDLQSVHHSLTLAEEEKYQYYRQLLNEQNRVSRLESYIQLCTAKHSQQLDGIEKTQSRISETVATEWSAFQSKFDSIGSKLECSLISSLRDGLQELGKVRSEETHELSSLKDMIAEALKIASEYTYLVPQLQSETRTLSINSVTAIEKISTCLSETEKISMIIEEHCEKDKSKSLLEDRLRNAQSEIVSLTKAHDDFRLRERSLEAEREEARLSQEKFKDTLKERDRHLMGYQKASAEVMDLRQQLEKTSTSIAVYEQQVKEKDEKIVALGNSLDHATINFEARYKELQSQNEALRNIGNEIQMRVREELDRSRVRMEEQNDAHQKRIIDQMRDEQNLLVTEREVLTRSIEVVKAQISTLNISFQDCKTQSTDLDCERINCQATAPNRSHPDFGSPLRDQGLQTSTENVNAATDSGYNRNFVREKFKTDVRALLQRVQAAESRVREVETALRQLQLIRSQESLPKNLQDVVTNLKQMISQVTTVPVHVADTGSTQKCMKRQGSIQAEDRTKRWKGDIESSTKMTEKNDTRCADTESSHPDLLEPHIADNSSIPFGIVPFSTTHSQFAKDIVSAPDDDDDAGLESLFLSDLLEREIADLEAQNLGTFEKAPPDNSSAASRHVSREKLAGHVDDTPQTANEIDRGRDSPLTSVDSEIFAESHVNEQLANVTTHDDANPSGSLSRTSSSESKLHIDGVEKSSTEIAASSDRTIKPRSRGSLRYSTRKSCSDNKAEGFVSSQLLQGSSSLVSEKENEPSTIKRASAKGKRKSKSRGTRYNSRFGREVLNQ